MASKEARKKYQELMCWYGYQIPNYIVRNQQEWLRLKHYKEYFPFHVTQKIIREMDQVIQEEKCSRSALHSPVDNFYDPNEEIN